MNEFKESLRQIGRDLLNLEINTIVKSNVTARKMPVVPHAVLDIAQTYADKLNTLQVNLNLFFDGEKEEKEISDSKYWGETRKPTNDRFNNECLRNGFDTFMRLRWAARAAVEEKGADPAIDSSDVVILQRIRRNSDQLRAVLQTLERKHSDLFGKKRAELGYEKQRQTPFNADDLALIRKIWEIGIEKVVMQTVIQLDGDLITRIQQDYAKPQFKYLHDFHLQGIVMAMRSWEMIAKAVATFFSGLAGAIGR